MFSFLQKKKKGSVFVGLSGGVDSAVSAALLKQQGYDVTGVYLRTWQPDWITCTWQDERRDAMRVCSALDIPFIEYNVSDEYKKRVTEDMLENYRNGRTPNPDVLCNKEIKFGLFFDWAMNNSADFVATGHYAQVTTVNGASQLVAAKDTSKDQSYFLWTLSPDILSKTIFPVGNLLKTEVRDLAKKFHVPVAQKKDSQGICFLGLVDMKEFLAHYIQVTEGQEVTSAGKTIGTHQGVELYTYGERHGFNAQNEKGSTHEPLYVIGRDQKTNTLTVGTHDEYIQVGQSKKEYTLTDIVLRTVIKDNKIYDAAFRYHGKRYQVRVKQNSTTLTILFENPEELIAPGQSIVLYDGNTCIGGGIVA